VAGRLTLKPSSAGVSSIWHESRLLGVHGTAVESSMSSSSARAWGSFNEDMAGGAGEATAAISGNGVDAGIDGSLHQAAPRAAADGVLAAVSRLQMDCDFAHVVFVVALFFLLLLINSG